MRSVYHFRQANQFQKIKSGTDFPGFNIFISCPTVETLRSALRALSGTCLVVSLFNSFLPLWCKWSLHIAFF